MTHINSFLVNLKSITQQYCRSAGGLSKEVATSWEHVYSMRRDLYSTIRNYPSVFSASYIALGGAYVMLWETGATMYLPPDAYHHVQGYASNGSAYDQVAGAPAAARTIWAEVVPDWTGDFYNWGTTFERCDFDYNNHIRMDESTPLMNPCTSDSHGDIVGYALSPPVPLHMAYFMGMFSGGSYLMMQIGCEFGNSVTGETYGAIFLATELGNIQAFLQTLEFGAAEYGRVYIMVRSSRQLVGASHGLSYQVVPYRGRMSKMPILAKNCTDALVARSATELEALDSRTNMSRFDTLASGDLETVQLRTNRTPAGEPFFVGVKVIKIQMGPNWYVVSLLDEHHVLGAINAAERATQQDIKKRQGDVEDDLTRARNILYAVLVVAALVPVALAVVLVFRVTQPLILLVHNMSRVAVMDLEGVKAVDASMLDEVEGMNTSFRAMVKNLVEYKQYLPQSVLLMGSSGDESQSNETADATVIESRLSTNSGRSRTQARGVAAVHFGDGVTTRHITMLVSNVIGSHELAAHDLKDAITQHVACFMSFAKDHYGLPEVVGDKVAVTINTLLNTNRHKMQACELASKARDRMAEHFNVNMAVATGSAVCGNFGCTGLKKYTVFGSIGSTVYALERFGRSYDIPIVCDGSIAADAESLFFLRRIAIVVTKCGKSTMLHELAGAKSCANDEWMYQMEEASLNDVYRPVNDAVDAIYSFDLERAERCMEQATVGNEFALGLLEHARATSAAPDPVNLFAKILVFPEKGVELKK